MSWFFYTIAGLFCVAIADISQKLTLKGKSPLSSITNNFLVWNSIGVISLVYFLVFRLPTPILPSYYFLKMVPLAVVYFLGGTFYYQSFKSNSVSLSAVLATISSVITTVLGIVLFNESSSGQKFIGALVVLGAIVIVNYQKKLKIDKYNYLALAGGVMYGLAYTMDKYFVLATSPDYYQIFLCFYVGLASALFRPRQIVDELKEFRSGLIPSIVSAIFFFFLYQKFLFKALSIGGEVGRIDVLNNTTIFLIILIEVLFLRERTNLRKKIVSAIVAFTGASILALAR